LAADWLLETERLAPVLIVLLTLLTGLVASWLVGPRITALKFGLLALGLALIFAWGRA
jgi:hypothetical protein